jgi:hypothetical protein
MMKGILRISLVLALALVICLPVVASADVTLYYQTVVPSSPYANIYAHSGSTTYNGGVLIGNYTYKLGSTSNPTIYGYCVDIQDSPDKNVPTNYTREAIDPGTVEAAVAWILSQGYSGTQAQEAQAAIWELVWDYAVGNKTCDLTADNFILNSLSSYPSGVTLASFRSATCTIYSNAVDAAITDSWDPSGYYILHNDEYQDFVVPLPPSALLLGSGLLGLVGLGWRRRRNG